MLKSRTVNLFPQFTLAFSSIVDRVFNLLIRALGFQSAV